MSGLFNQASEIRSLVGPFDEAWVCTTRSIRINGKVTSVRLENFYWNVIRGIAQEKSMPLPKLMTIFSGIAKSSETEHANFTSFLRVCCGRYLQSKMEHVVESNQTYSSSAEVGRHWKDGKADMSAVVL